MLPAFCSFSLMSTDDLGVMANAKVLVMYTDVKYPSSPMYNVLIES